MQNCLVGLGACITCYDCHSDQGTCNEGECEGVVCIKMETSNKDVTNTLIDPWSTDIPRKNLDSRPSLQVKKLIMLVKPAALFTNLVVMISRKQAVSRALSGANGLADAFATLRFVTGIR